MEEEISTYERAVAALWRRVHGSISHERDIYKSQTEDRLSVLSGRAILQDRGWPELLKSFLWRKNGDGCMARDARD